MAFDHLTVPGTLFLLHDLLLFSRGVRVTNWVSVTLSRSRGASPGCGLEEQHILASYHRLSPTDSLTDVRGPPTFSVFVCSRPRISVMKPIIRVTAYPQVNRNDNLSSFDYSGQTLG